MGRHVVTQRANGLYSRYSYDAGGRLRELRHHDRNKVLARFQYNVDKRGNRTQAFEALARPSSIVQTIGIADGAVSYYKGIWTTSGSYKQTTQFSSAMTISFTGNEAVLTMGTGTDHGIYDVYIDGSLWESFDGCSTTGADRPINIYLDKRLDQTDVHIIDIRNRAEKNKNSSGYTLRFKQLVILNTTYDRQTINYGYDALARLLTASYVGVSPSRSYQYAFDRAGNRTQQIVTIGGTPTTTDYEYTTANQILRSRVNAGAWTNFTYDNNGNLTSDGVNSYTWDRANRLLSMGGASYQYDGEGRRVQQTVSSVVTKYLLDIQPSLAVVLSETTDANAMRYVHSPRGIHAHKDTGGNWEWMVQDGLGSVREVVDNSVGVLESRNYDPYGNAFGATGTSQTGYGFTGEQMDGSGLLDLRARRYNAGLGVFASLDPFEGMRNRAMSLNGYSWVEGNVPNAIDPTGMIYELPSRWVSCMPTITMSSQCVADTDQECEICCWEKWRGENSDIAQMGFDNCMLSCSPDAENQRRKAQAAKVAAEKRCENLRSYAQRLIDSKQHQYNGREVLVEVIRFADATYNYATSRELSDDVSCAVTGARGKDTLIQASSFGSQGIGYFGFGSGGWNKDYDDTTDNQAFHLWSYVNSAAQGGSLLALLGDYGHECIDITDGSMGWSQADSRLAMAGTFLGTMIYYGFPANQVDEWVDEWIGRRSFNDFLKTYNWEGVLNNLNIRVCPLIDAVGGR